MALLIALAPSTTSKSAKSIAGALPDVPGFHRISGLSKLMYLSKGVRKRCWSGDGESRPTCALAALIALAPLFIFRFPLVQYLIRCAFLSQLIR